MSNVVQRIKAIEVFGLPVVGAVVAAMAVFVYQWMWLGSVFKTRWNLLIGLTEEQLVVPQTWWAIGFGFITAQMLGVAYVLSRAGWPGLGRTVGELSVASALLAVPLAAYPLLYHPDHSWERFAYEAGAYVSGWIVGGLIVRSLKADPIQVEPETSAAARPAPVG